MSQIEQPEFRPTQVAIAIIRRGRNFLIRVRPPGGPMPGVYEFAGGKCESGETPEQTAVREAMEETGMRITVVKLRTSFEHHYDHGHIHLYYFDCLPEPLNAEPSPESGFHWVLGSLLPSLTFPPANEAVVNELAKESVIKTTAEES